MTNLFTKKFMKVPKIPLRHFVQEIGRNAFVDWLFILGTNICLIILAIAGGFYLYWKISSGHFIVSKPSTATETGIFDEKELTSVINRFQVKSDLTDQIKRGYRGPSDPSL